MVSLSKTWPYSSEHWGSVDLPDLYEVKACCQISAQPLHPSPYNDAQDVGCLLQGRPT